MPRFTITVEISNSEQTYITYYTGAELTDSKDCMLSLNKEDRKAFDTFEDAEAAVPRLRNLLRHRRAGIVVHQLQEDGATGFVSSLLTADAYHTNMLRAGDFEFCGWDAEIEWWKQVCLNGTASLPYPEKPEGGIIVGVPEEEYQFITTLFDVYEGMESYYTGTDNVEADPRSPFLQSPDTRFIPLKDPKGSLRLLSMSSRLRRGYIFLHTVGVESNESKREACVEMTDKFKLALMQKAGDLIGAPEESQKTFPAALEWWQKHVLSV